MYRKVRLATLLPVLVLIITVCGCGENEAEDRGSANDGFITNSNPGRNAGAPSGVRKPVLRGADGLPAGCQPEQVGRTFDDLFEATRSPTEATLLQHISMNPEFVSFIFYLGTKPGEARLDARTPDQVPGLFTKLIGFGQPRLLAAQVGRVAPRYGSQSPPRSSAGVDFALQVGARTIASGKAGLDCAKGRFYLWAMGLDHEGEHLQVCDRLVKLNVSKPRVCAYEF